MQSGNAPKRLEADLHARKCMSLLVGDCDDGIEFDHADWAGAVLVLTSGATQRPQTTAAPQCPKWPRPPSSRKRRSNRPSTARESSAARRADRFCFSFRPRAKNRSTSPPRIYRRGSRSIAETGIISGTLGSSVVEPAGVKTDRSIVWPAERIRATSYVVEIEVKNARGNAKRELTIVGGQHKLALTPPMGWNSWNCWASAVSDAKVRAAADAMVKSGLAAHGFQYVNIDDCWEGDRDADGEIQTNKKFPDMKALADYVHSKGLKLGIYSSPGPKTCAGYEASWKHEAQDAATYANWGVDYLKYDWCSYGEIARNPDRAALMKPYQVMRKGLDECNRDIVFSLCQYGMGDVWKWGAEVGGNCWRTTGDITDNWGSMSGIGFGQDGHEKYAGPGHWNDPDMLVVGKVGWGPSLHPTKLKPNEQITHISLWCLLSSPLLIGCDMSSMDPFTVAVLTNDEVLAINQDPLGKPAGRILKNGQTEVWARPLFDGTTAVGLFNRSSQPAKVKVSWSDLKREARRPVRDLWQHKDLGEQADGYEATVPPHGTVLVKVGKG